MAGNDWSTTARALAEQYSDDGDHILPISNDSRRSTSPIWSRRSLDTTAHTNASPRSRSSRQKWIQGATKSYTMLVRRMEKLPLWQQFAVFVLGVTTMVLTVLFLVYNERIFAWLTPAAKRWRDLPAGWLILWFMTFFVSFPPMIGYSTCVTIAGFVFGMKGWFIMATATILGSTASFVVSRTVLKNYVSKMTDKNKQFAALSLVLKHDGLKLLCMIRLCPLPYSFANGAISTIPTVTWPNFMIATAIASPKLLLHIFVGTQMAAIGESGAKMDAKTKAISYGSAILGIIFGAVVGYVIYARTKARAKTLEAEEAAAATSGRRTSDAANSFIDDPDEQEAVDILRARESDISLHQTYEDDSDVERGYRDEYTVDDDALERDVFDVGDGETDDETVAKKKGDT